MALREVSWVDGVVQHTLVALASGFFLYVGLMEVVAKELVNYQTKGSGVFAFLKLLMLVLGFAAMSLAFGVFAPPSWLAGVLRAGGRGVGGRAPSVANARCVRHLACRGLLCV